MLYESDNAFRTSNALIPGSVATTRVLCRAGKNLRFFKKFLGF